MKIKSESLLIFFLVLLSVPCFAGGIKGPLVDEKTIALFILFVVLVHVFTILAFVCRVRWLRIICGILYLPLFGIPILLMFFHGSFVILLIPMVVFYVALIVLKRK